MTLYVGYKASDIKPEMLGDDSVFHTLDVYHRHAIEKVHHARAVCSPHLPEGEWDKVCFLTGPKLMSGELSLDMLQECRRVADKCGCKVEVRFVGRERDRNDLLDKVRDRTDRVFKAEWPASVPGGSQLTFTSYPGCFCHRRLDEGGLALAEVVTRELKSRVEVEDRKLRLLDMGCGCGLVGFLITDYIRKSSPSALQLETSTSSSPLDLVLVDSHSRAVEAAEENSRKFGIPAEVILSDNGTPSRMDGTFDVFVGNPPYYSDYRIADVFLETAKRALRPGGICYTVCKNAAGLEPVQKKYFPEVNIIKRRGYAVLKSISCA